KRGDVDANVDVARRLPVGELKLIGLAVHVGPGAYDCKGRSGTRCVSCDDWTADVAVAPAGRQRGCLRGGRRRSPNQCTYECERQSSALSAEFRQNCVLL